MRSTFQDRLAAAAALITLIFLAQGVRAEEPERQGTARVRVPEVVEMFWSIVVQGPMMGPGSGWFHAAESRFDWKRLSGRLDRDGDARIAREEWSAPVELFGRLDRDGDGVIQASDLDWSPQSPFLAQQQAARRVFGRFDADSNGKVSPEEFQAQYRRMAGEKGFLAADDLAPILAVPASRGGRAQSAAPALLAGPYPALPFLPSQVEAVRRYLIAGPEGSPSRFVLFKGLFTAEIGSPFEGPSIGQDAPDFVLPAQGGDELVRLSAFKGQGPVVLIFGSFT